MLRTGVIIGLSCPPKPLRFLTQYVLVPHQHCLVDLGLAEPAGLLCGEEHFDGHLLPAPLAHPHLAIAALTNLLHHLDLLGDGALHLVGEGVKEVGMSVCVCQLWGLVHRVTFNQLFTCFNHITKACQVRWHNRAAHINKITPLRLHKSQGDKVDMKLHLKR